MRTDILHIGAGELSYEIRNIIRVADRLQRMGVKVNLENIGDPVAKGEKIPTWMKEIVARETMENDTWGYCPTDKNFKPADQLIRTLVEVSSRGGNFLLNVGPQNTISNSRATT